MKRAHTANIEVQVLEGIVLGGGDTEKTSRYIRSSACCRLVLGEGVYQAMIRLKVTLPHSRDAPLAMSMRVVPVSTIPAVSDKIVVEP